MFCNCTISPGGRKMSVSPKPDTIITINRVGQETDCSVCENEGSSQKCNQNHLVLKDATNVSVEFTCPQPQDVFAIVINREIGMITITDLSVSAVKVCGSPLKRSSVHISDCRKIPCSGDIVKPESSLFPTFNRTFTWDLSINPSQAFILDVPEAGLHQIPNEDTCPDEHTYTLVTYLRLGPVTIGTFCTGGTITTILVLYKARMTLQVPGDRTLEPMEFKLNNGPETKSKYLFVVTAGGIQ